MVQQAEIKVEQDILNMAKDATRAQFAQYGMLSVPEDILENYAKEMLKKKESIDGLVNRVVEAKLAAVLKGKVTLEKQSGLCRRIPTLYLNKLDITKDKEHRGVQGCRDFHEIYSVLFVSLCSFFVSLLSDQ